MKRDIHTGAPAEALAWLRIAYRKYGFQNGGCVLRSLTAGMEDEGETGGNHAPPGPDETGFLTP